MLSLSTTSTFEYPYLDTMRPSTKGRYFGGQGGCIILATKTDRDWPFTRLMLWEVAFNQSYQSEFWFFSGHSCVLIWSIKVRCYFDLEGAAKSPLIDSQSRSSMDFSLLILSLIYNSTFQIRLNWSCSKFEWIYICCKCESNFYWDRIFCSLQKVKRSIESYVGEFNLKLKLPDCTWFPPPPLWFWPGQVILGYAEYN